MLLKEEPDSHDFRGAEVCGMMNTAGLVLVGHGDGRAELGGELGDGEDDQFLPVLSRC